MGFGVPLERWFRDELKDLARDALLSEKSVKRGYFKKDYLEELLNEHLSCKADHSYRIWALVVLEMWHRMFIDGERL